MALWDKLTVAKTQARCRGNKIANRNRRHCENSSKMQEKGRYNARNCCVNSYITKRSSEAPHLTELRLVIQLCNPAPVETKKERQTNKTAGAGGAPLPQPAEAGVAEGWSPRAQPPRGAGNGRSPCGVPPPPLLIPVISVHRGCLGSGAGPLSARLPLPPGASHSDSHLPPATDASRKPRRRQRAPLGAPLPSHARRIRVE